MARLSGQCLCGNIQFNTDAEPAFSANCHCTECRRSTGAAYATLLFFKSDDVNISGKTRTWSHQSDRDTTMTKHFCGECGSQMFGESGAREDMIGLRAGVINEKELIKPQRNLFAESKIPSTPLDDAIPAVERMS